MFYKEHGAVRDNVTAYVAATLRAGESALVIAKPELLQQLTIEVHRQHVHGTPFGPQRGRLVMMDAEATLARICLDGSPDRALFHDIVGGALEALRSDGKRVSAYGEMVGVLCEQGQYADAVMLEGLWNELLAKAEASLFCGYSSDLFESPGGQAFYEQIRAAHTHVHHGHDLGKGVAVAEGLR